MLALSSAMAYPAFASPIYLNFEGIVPPDSAFGSTAIGNFYNGSGGAANDFGVTFSPNAMADCLSTTVPTPAGNHCANASHLGLGDPNSQLGALEFGDQMNEPIMRYIDVAAGFGTDFSLDYTKPTYDTAPGYAAIYSGLNGTGTLLATLTLPSFVNPPSCPTGYQCPFEYAGIDFSGTAESVSLYGAVDIYDDITFGDAPVSPAPVPEPSTIGLVASGLSAMLALRKRRILH